MATFKELADNFLTARSVYECSDFGNAAIDCFIKVEEEFMDAIGEYNDEMSRFDGYQVDTNNVRLYGVCEDQSTYCVDFIMSLKDFEAAR